MAPALAPEGATLVRSRDARAALVEFQRKIERSDIVADRIPGRLKRIEPVLNRYRAMHVGQEGDVRFAVRSDLEAMNESQEFKEGQTLTARLSNSGQAPKKKTEKVMAERPVLLVGRELIVRR